MQEILFESAPWFTWTTEPTPHALSRDEAFWEINNTSPFDDSSSTLLYDEDAPMTNTHCQYDPDDFVLPSRNDPFFADLSYAPISIFESDMVSGLDTSMTALDGSDDFASEPVSSATRRSSRQLKTTRADPDFIYSTNWREGPEYIEFKGLGLSPKKCDPAKRASRGSVSNEFDSSKHPVIDSFLTCVSLDMGAQFTRCTDDSVEIYIRDMDRLLRALAYNCSKARPTTSAECRVKSIRRWFDGMPSRGNLTKVRSGYIIKSRNDSNGNLAPRLREFANQLKLKVAPKSPAKNAESALRKSLGANH